jgi:hypothetical protein
MPEWRLPLLRKNMIYCPELVDHYILRHRELARRRELWDPAYGNLTAGHPALHLNLPEICLAYRTESQLCQLIEFPDLRN